MSESFTYLSPEAINEIILRMRDSGEKYPMELNAEDFAAVVRALEFTWQLSLLPEEVLERVRDIISGIGETLGVDMV